MQPSPAVAGIRNLEPGRGPLLLYLCPTQELSVQVARQAELLVEAAGFKLGVVSLLGGSPLSRQESALKRKPHIVVGTPGRIADLGRAGILRLDRLEFLVLDEGDRLFSSEYREQVLWVLENSSSRTCKILASATISTSTKRLASGFMRDPISIDLKDEGVLSRDIEHWVFYV